MSFERTKGSITNLSGRKISADDLLDMLVCVTRDVYEENHVTSPTALQVVDQGVLLKKMYNLIKMVLAIYDGNQDGIVQFSERIRGEYTRSIENIAVYETVISGLLEEMEHEEEKRNALQVLHADVEERRGHLLTVKEECNVLQRRIDELNDSRLDEMAARKETLEAELASHSARAQELNSEQAALQADLDAAEERVATLVGAIAGLREQLSGLQSEESSAREEKNHLEQSIDYVKARLEEARQQIGNLPILSKKIQDEYQEIQIQLTVMLNAFNSAKSDAFLAENLFALPGSSKVFTVDSYPDLAICGKRINNWAELENWFAELEQRISGLLEVLRSMLAVLVDKSESITSKKDQE